MKSMPWIVSFVVCVIFCTEVAVGQKLSERLQREAPAALAAAAREQGSAVRGAILFPQRKVGCANCHVPGNDRLTGPDLTRLEAGLSDEHLVDAVLRPSKSIRKGFETVSVLTTDGKSIVGRVLNRSDQEVVLREVSAEQRVVTVPISEIDDIATNKTSGMPDNLVDQLQDRQQFLDLMRYVMEITSSVDRHSDAPQHVVGGVEIDEKLQGLVLLKEFNCTACHKDNRTTTLVSVRSAPDLKWMSGRIDLGYVQRFLENPHSVKPGTSMPAVFDSLSRERRHEYAEALTHFLGSLSDRSFRREPIDNERADRGRELFHAIGCVACHAPRDKNGAELQKGDSVSLNSVGTKYNLPGLVEFLRDPHLSRPTGRMPNMKLTHWEALDVAHFLLSGSAAPQAVDFNVDSKLAAKGRSLFQQQGCANCHAMVDMQSVSTAPALAGVRTEHGCLSGKTGEWPRFDFKPKQLNALRAALTMPNRQLNDIEQINISLTAFRCLNCHQRDELGGVSAERNPHFQTTNPNLGPQGRLPPTLTGVGAKLQPKWLRQVLVSGRAIRPYQKTRMPQFGTQNVEHLVELLQMTDRVPDVEFAEFKDQKTVRTAGLEMAGTGGLNCIACHTFQMKQAATMPAVDLTEMSERLHHSWFYRYMKDPQKFSHNTVMPSFWPGGRSFRKDILDGDTNQQIEALWQYLLDGRQARSPKGLIHEPMELLATDEAVMLRRSYRGIGKRGIGVGYPGQVNLAWDAEHLRLAILWPGKFADPGGVWRSQGHGTVRPLDRRQVHFAKGPDLDDAKTPWVVDESRPPQHRFKGYSLDGKMRPRFRYQFEEITVEDYCVDVIDEAAKERFLRRQLTLQSDDGRAGLLFRAASGKRIVELSDHVFRVDESVTVRIDHRYAVDVVEIPDGQKLNIRLNVPQGKSTLVVEYVWPGSK